jgi:hypothetical protein
VFDVTKIGLLEDSSMTVFLNMVGRHIAFTSPLVVQYTTSASLQRAKDATFSDTNFKVPSIHAKSVPSL